VPCVSAGGSAAASAAGAVPGGRISPAGGNYTLPQPASVPTMIHRNTRSALRHDRRKRIMLIILLEALLALVLFVLIVWWTMFAGRDKGEPRRDEPES
jgi:hypothetical protein